MSKCLKCGASLPPVGECPTCAAASQPAGRPVPSLLDKEIHIDRRRPDRDASAPAAPATPPGMMARTPVPPGMTPAQAAPRAPGLPVMPPRPPAPSAPAPQAPAMPSAHALRPQPAPAPAPVQAAAPRPPPPAPVPPSAPAFNLPGVAAPAPRTNTAVFGALAAAATPPPAPPAAALDLTAEEEAFSVDVEETEEVETLAPPPPPPAVAARPAPAPAPAPSRLPNVPAPVRAPVSQAAPAVRAPVPVPVPVPARVAPGPDIAEVHARPASLWRRLLAFSIDTGAIAAVAALYLMLASSVAGVQTPETGLSGLDAFVHQVRSLQSVLVPGAVLVLLLSLVYCTVSAFLWNGRTLGRGLLGLRLVDTHGLAPAPGRAVVRAVLASLSFGLFLAGFWMALFDRRGQTLHDKLTSTYVVQPS